MLDDSISSAQDIERAREIGATWVKLKLCKHPGMSETKRLIKVAQASGLKLVFGNGVQSAVGNHLESRIYSDTGITAAGEQNGFLKVSETPFAYQMCLQDGYLVDNGIFDPVPTFDPGINRIAVWRFDPDDDIART